jgi:hypothetical protein
MIIYFDLVTWCELVSVYVGLQLQLNYQPSYLT